MFWNARGVQPILLDLLDRLEELHASLCGIMESKVYGEDLSRGKWKWQRGK